MSTTISAEDFIRLKKLVTEECEARKYKAQNEDGIASEYGEGRYEFEIQPNADEKILLEHYEKIMKPLQAINKDKINELGLDDLTKEKIVSKQQLDNLESIVKEYKEFRLANKGTNNSDCSQACVGWCFSACASTCKGVCSGCTGCVGNCSNVCKSHCASGCSGDCSILCVWTSR